MQTQNGKKQCQIWLIVCGVAINLDSYIFYVRGINWGKSIDCFGHDFIKLLICDLLFLSLSCPQNHLVQHLVIILFSQYLGHFLQILESNKAFAFSVIFFENMMHGSMVNFFLWLAHHCIHKLMEWYATSFFHIIFSYYFVNGLFTRSITILT